MDTSIKDAAKKVMVVDDEETLRAIYAAVFAENDLVITQAKDGQEAWDILQSGYLPDLVFTGIVMPRMTGFDLIEAMRKDNRFSKIPVVIFSHAGRAEDKKRAEDLKVSDFIFQGLVKPPETVRRIKAILGTSTKFRISYWVPKLDGKSLLDTLNSQQPKKCLPPMSGEVTLEIEAVEKDLFRIKPIC